MFFTESTNGGGLWSARERSRADGDRGYYTAPAISPNGTDVYVVYNAFTTPVPPNTATHRSRCWRRAACALVRDPGEATGGFRTDPPQHPAAGTRAARPEQPGRRVPGRLRLTPPPPGPMARLSGNDTRYAVDCPAIDLGGSRSNRWPSPRPPPSRLACPPSATRTSSRSRTAQPSREDDNSGRAGPTAAPPAARSARQPRALPASPARCKTPGEGAARDQHRADREERERAGDRAEEGEVVERRASRSSTPKRAKQAS